MFYVRGTALSYIWWLHLLIVTRNRLMDISVVCQWFLDLHGHMLAMRAFCFFWLAHDVNGFHIMIYIYIYMYISCVCVCSFW